MPSRRVVSYITTFFCALIRPSLQCFRHTETCRIDQRRFRTTKKNRPSRGKDGFSCRRLLPASPFRRDSGQTADNRDGSGEIVDISAHHPPNHGLIIVHFHPVVNSHPEWCSRFCYTVHAMQKRTVLERLAAELTGDERRRMLESLQDSLKEHAPEADGERGREPLPDFPPLVEHVASLGVWGRVRLFLVRLFTGRTTEQVVTAWVLKALRSRIQRSLGDAADLRRQIFLEPFAADLDRLRVAGASLLPLVEVVADDRDAFILTVATQLFPEVHADLLQRTSRDHLRDRGTTGDRALRTELTEVLERALAGLPSRIVAQGRRTVTQADRLVRVAHAPLGRMLETFTGSPDQGGRSGPMEYLARGLEMLAGELSSVTEPLEPVLLESVALVMLAGRSATEEPEADDVRGQLESISRAVGTLRRFFARYPLTAIVRLLRQDPWWSPTPPAEGPEWLSRYRAVLQDRIAAQVLQVSLQRQAAAQMDLLREIAEGEIRPLPGLPAAEGRAHSRRWHPAAVLNTFAAGIWRDTVPPLKVVLHNGEFYKSGNRAQFNDTCNDYEALPEQVRELQKLAEAADCGDTPEGRKTLEHLDRQVDETIGRVRITIETMVNLLSGILYARPGSSYDTLANLGQIAGRRNAEFLEELRVVQGTLQRILGILLELETLCRRADEHDIPLLRME
jgi:hypothetical protein